jgi:hypothetical protein
MSSAEVLVLYGKCEITSEPVDLEIKARSATFSL